MTDAVHVRYGDLLRGEDQASPIIASNVTDALYEAMWRRLVNLEFEPGVRLSDEALAREFGVSRTPVREALYRLSQVGLVQVNARRGFFVTRLTPRSVGELFDVRTALESWAARIATPRISPPELHPYVPATDGRRDRIGPIDAEAFVRSDLSLHFFIVSRAGNDRLAQSLRDVSGQLAVVVLRLALSAETRLHAIEEHARIVASMVAGDARAAADAMEEHIQNVKHRALAEFQRSSTRTEKED